MVGVSRKSGAAIPAAVLVVVLAAAAAAQQPARPLGPPPDAAWPSEAGAAGAFAPHLQPLGPGIDPGPAPEATRRPSPADTPGRRSEEVRAPDAPPHPARRRLRRALERLLERPALDPARARLESLADRLGARRAGDRAALALLALVAGVLGGPLLLFGLLPLLRGKGDLTVALHYPDELRGTFRVRVQKRRSRRRAPPDARGDADATGGDRAASRTDHPQVARETRFHRLAARSWWVSVEGVLRDPESDEQLEPCLAEERVRVRRGRTTRVSLDFQPEACPVDVKVLWDKRPVREARVAVHGVPGSVRFARGGTVRLKLARGTHTLVVGSEDRVVEYPVDVGSFRATWAVVDLAADEGELLFKGCPPAVEPYLQGDFSGAARALEREGQGAVAHLLLARLDRDQGRNARAAEHYEAAERFAEAAELHASLGSFARAAALWERLGEPARAAEMYRASGSLLDAGRAFEQAEDYDSAVACYREAGDRPHLAGALERRGSYFEAAQVCLEANDWNRAIRDLQHVAPGDARYTDACRLLGEAYQRVGEVDLAVQKLEEVVRSRGETVPPEVQRSLAEALERAGEIRRALEVYEAVRARDPDHPGVETRIEALRKKLSQETDASVPPGRPGGGGTLTAPGVGRYEILAEIGRGGMGVVYRARDRRLGREVALKRLPENLRHHPRAVELFLREARAAAALNHPNIVTLFDADEEDGSFFITMELLQGENLYAILRRVGRAKPRDVARLGVQVCAGLGYAHDNGVVHRDVKTANLFFTNDRIVKVMDFGLAKMTEEVRRATTVVAGTPYYMAPEQAAGRSVDHRADLYALGVTLFELSTGRLPFEEGDVSLHHRVTPPPDPREHVALPAALAELILDCMAKSPDDRPASAAVVGARLQELLAAR